MKQVRLNGRGARGFLTAGMATAALACFASPASATNFTVTGFGDEPDASCAGPSCTSLRAALTAANAANDTDTISLGAGEHVLSLDGALEEANASGDLDVAAGSPVTIQGQGPGATSIKQTLQDHVLEGWGGFTARGLTITGGNPVNKGGGGVSQQAGILTLDNIQVSANSALRGGGVFAGSGAGVNATDSTVSDNTAQNNSTDTGGGGIAFAAAGTTPGVGALNLSNVTIARNRVTGRNGGGLFVAGNRPVSLTNVTFSENSAAGGLGNNVFRGAGAPALIAKNTLLAGDATNMCASTGGAAPFDSSRGGNLAGGETCQLDGATNNRNSATPAVGSLGYFGGPGRVQTVSLRRGSQALGLGANCTTADARGFTRPAARCDAGAHEQERVSLTTSVAASADPIQFGQVLTYTATATNPSSSPIAITGTRLTTGTAAQATFVDAVASNGSCTTPNSGESITCNLGTLAPGQSVTVTLRVRVDKAGGSIATGFTFTGNEPGAAAGSQLATVINGGPPAPPVTPPGGGQSGGGQGGGQGGGGQGGTTPPGTNPLPDVTLRAASPSRRTLIRLRRISLRATASEASTVAFTLTLSGRTLGRTTVRFTRAGERRVTLRLTTAGVRALRRARTNARLTLTARATDSTGNRSTKRRTLRLKR